MTEKQLSHHDAIPSCKRMRYLELAVGFDLSVRLQSDGIAIKAARPKTDFIEFLTSGGDESSGCFLRQSQNQVNDC